MAESSSFVSSDPGTAFAGAASTLVFLTSTISTSASLSALRFLVGIEALATLVEDAMFSRLCSLLKNLLVMSVSLSLSSEITWTTGTGLTFGSVAEADTATGDLGVLTGAAALGLSVPAAGGFPKNLFSSVSVYVEGSF